MCAISEDIRSRLDVLAAAGAVLPCLSVLPPLLAQLHEKLFDLSRDVQALHEQKVKMEAAPWPYAGQSASHCTAAQGAGVSASEQDPQPDQGLNALERWQNAVALHGLAASALAKSENVEDSCNEDECQADGKTTSAVALSCKEHRICLRYFYSGQKAGQGKVLLLKGQGWDVTAGSVRRRLWSAGINLKRFAANFYSEEWSGFCALPERNEELLRAVPLDGSSDNGCIDVQLEELPGLTEMALRTLRLDAPLGFFGIGIIRGKTLTNHGLLWRSALQLGAAFTYTVGARYEPRLDGMSDRYHCASSCPQWTFRDFADFTIGAPFGAALVAVEMGGKPLDGFEHPERCVYLLGSEDGGLPSTVLQACHAVVSIPDIRASSFNVAVAGSIVMYDRLAKERSRQLQHSPLLDKKGPNVAGTADEAQGHCRHLDHQS